MADSVCSLPFSTYFSVLLAVTVSLRYGFSFPSNGQPYLIQLHFKDVLTVP